jgi:hypothetical protein
VFYGNKDVSIKKGQNMQNMVISKRHGTLYKLDNAATIYPAVSKKNWNNVFRVSIYLKEAVRPEVLRQAVVDLAPRFPTFYVQVFDGFLWNYFKPVKNYDIVREDSGSPCRPFILRKGDKPVFRVLYQGNRISVEFFHAVTDGTGGMTYLKTLAARYLQLSGHSIEAGEGVLNIADLPLQAETEDSFQKIYKKAPRVSRKEPNAYQYQVNKKNGYLSSLNCEVSVAELKKVAKQYQCTITEFLVAVYGYAFLQEKAGDRNNKTRKYPVRICSPANLRPLADSATLRNFAMLANIDMEGDSTPTSFEQMLQYSLPNMKKGWGKPALLALANVNVRDANMFIARIAPRAIKFPIIGFFGRLFGERKITSTLSNLGLQKLPDSMAQYVEKMDCVIGETALNKINCAVVGVGDRLNINFACVSDSMAIENRFISFLKSLAISVTVHTA